MRRCSPVHASRTAVIALAGTIAAVTAVLSATQLQAQQTPVNQDAKTMADFKTRVGVYVELHRKLEGSLPKLPEEATPQQIDSNQRNLGGLIAKTRATARQGDLFTPPMQQLVRTLIARVFTAANSRTLRESIQDENPGPVKIAINARYPDTVPLASMPAQILKALPPLPEELEYRFLGEALILLDTHAHIVVDFVPTALPRR